MNDCHNSLIVIPNVVFTLILLIIVIVLVIIICVIRYDQLKWYYTHPLTHTHSIHIYIYIIRYDQSKKLQRYYTHTHIYTSTHTHTHPPTHIHTHMWVYEHFNSMYRKKRKNAKQNNGNKKCNELILKERTYHQLKIEV